MEDGGGKPAGGGKRNRKRPGRRSRRCAALCSARHPLGWWPRERGWRSYSPAAELCPGCPPLGAAPVRPGFGTWLRGLAPRCARAPAAAIGPRLFCLFYVSLRLVEGCSASCGTEANTAPKAARPLLPTAQAGQRRCWCLSLLRTAHCRCCREHLASWAVLGSPVSPLHAHG